MAKLKCMHGRRVMVIPALDDTILKSIHREDGSACSGPRVKLKGEIFELWEVCGMPLDPNGDCGTDISHNYPADVSEATQSLKEIVNRNARERRG